MFLFLLVASIFALGSSTNSVPTRSPYPTAKSGSPSLALVCFSVFGAILFIVISVLFLCFKKSDDNIPEKMSQPLIQNENTQNNN
ncbi:hypothetical protein TVAG_354300 [Trichomonas vaginalis G3]|uniref:Uncharacterized protein n=1 Tax=Trichomonas vaginalis (strain ATCC PRA-98 / G3) TaxID=412133 RepID=A2F9C0_TRIV3|nr:hypothetical protein TVAGG3_0664200 [Trichomonas vaginalis G3]EAX98492.1 hypothetical protein TVAG_354300 [Trichomonas vaginalis G3]KAI5506722.1 hypothetical protein TVAGG3_0664200 [Trichomonas vaginalis G3]|eukprot:XP_001311422.1 hypothetical protein [Trichomonas vaginalis G3]